VARRAFIRHLPPSCVVLDLKAENKEEAIGALIEALRRAGRLADADRAREDVLTRERQLSTGLKDGLALPHAKTRGVAELALALGIKAEGLDFDSLDGEPARLIFLMLSPADKPGPHLQCLAEITAVCRDPALRRRLLAARTGEEALDILASA